MIMGLRSLFFCLVAVCTLANTYAQNFKLAPYQEVQNGHKVTGPSAQSQKKADMEDFANGIFLRTDVDKVELCENELLQVKWMLYYPNIPKLNVEYQISNYQIPNLPDFVKEWNIIANEGDSGVVRSVSVNGQPYRARTLLCFYMYPNKEGRATVDAGALTMQLYGADGKEYGKPLVLKSKPVSLNVKSLLSAPDNFTGGIGEYSINTELLKSDSVHLGETATFRVKVKGSGNFKFLTAPKFSFPDSVECYAVKPVNDIQYDCNKCSGERVFDFLLISKKVGRFEIPSSTISYFDSRSRKFKKLKTQACHLSVLPALPKTEIAVKKEALKQAKTKNSFNTWLYVCSILFGFLILLLILTFFHKRSEIKKRTDFELKAYDALNEAKTSCEGAAFYNKTVSILITYIGDKLNHPVPTQSKMVLMNILKENGASDAAVSLVLTVINECEKACYSPETDAKQDSIFETTVFAITQLQKDFDKTVRCSVISK